MDILEEVHVHILQVVKVELLHPDRCDSCGLVGVEGVFLLLGFGRGWRQLHALVFE